jgi:hypothetical protein
MVLDEALKKLQEQIAAWPMTQRFVVQQLIEDYRRDREDLRAYKATGLTPERCAEFARADAEGRYIVMRDAEQEGVARLRELAEADRAGRLVVLPCKVGDIVWANLDGKRLPRKCVIEFVNIGSHVTTIVFSTVDGLREQYGVNPSSFGKTVFLTREEAEKALEGIKDE